MAKKLLVQKFLLCLCIVLIAVTALFTAGCNKETNLVSSFSSTNEEVTVVGNGEKSFKFTVTDKLKKVYHYKVYTDKETVGEALLDLKLIDGTKDTYGLYVKSVLDITADYNTDGTYWAFYVNEKYADSGVDSTPIKDGETYSFKVES